MVCSKLKKGSCKITKKVCKAKYDVKMIRHKSCSIFKKAKAPKKKKKRYF